MRTIGVVAVLLAGCQGLNGVLGERGPPGEAGPQGIPGTPAGSPSMKWYDATGALVGPELTYVDAQGDQWTVDVETAQVSEFATLRATFTYFESTDCSGVAYYSAPIPRVPLFINDETTPRVRRETVQSVVVNSKSYSRFPSGTCIGALQTMRGVRLSDLQLLVAVPTLPFVGPLHRELR